MTAKLYALKLSHPAHAARLMLEHKAIEHRVVYLVPGFHPQALRALGFPRRTVPALRLDGRRIQGSVEISVALEQLQPDPPLYPADAAQRRSVQEAERWGEGVLQDVPRRLFRWATAGQPDLRRWIATEIAGLPSPRFLDRFNASVARRFARASDATDEHVRRDLAELPRLLDHVDELIEQGTIGAEEPNAADFQIATSVRVLIAFPSLRPALEQRPCAALAERLLPGYPDPIPAQVPRAWLSRPGPATVAA